MFNNNKEFLKGEVFINVEFPNGEKTTHHIGNTVQDTWTKALFQVVCKGYHETFSHTPGKITFGVENDADDAQATKDFNVGNRTTFWLSFYITNTGVYQYWDEIKIEETG